MLEKQFDGLGTMDIGAVLPFELELVGDKRDLDVVQISAVVIGIEYAREVDDGGLEASQRRGRRG
jgi:hypothetical protein